MLELNFFKHHKCCENPTPGTSGLGRKNGRRDGSLGSPTQDSHHEWLVWAFCPPLNSSWSEHQEHWTTTMWDTTPLQPSSQPTGRSRQQAIIVPILPEETPMDSEVSPLLFLPSEEQTEGLKHENTISSDFHNYSQLYNTHTTGSRHHPANHIIRQHCISQTLITQPWEYYFNTHIHTFTAMMQKRLHKFMKLTLFTYKHNNCGKQSCCFKHFLQLLHRSH